MERLETFAALLLEENRKQNLISRKSEDSLWLRHMADSAQLLGFVSRETSGPWLDLGTGAGFPGLVIAALRPEMRVVLVESRARRVEFLERVCEALSLKKVRVEGKRLELVEPFEAAVISARAFAPLTKLLSLSAPFSTRATTYLLPKGRSAAQECDKLPKKRRALFHVEQSITDAEAGIIVGQGG
ncbi:16S rRNA (guanine(527)-N(7))-methyltransferase RsmG [Altererythrobacter lutimaris]|uniref:Ribosomal RNA small subunit methyltransferase G n=1 Tax=Altererythrobacter lutimaris TaxID=2743979 RepID=A0A850HE48_9SPHN|nr:16S rRNA (guanine(527)-N(7))-methyltransferase RsmG [Altererythrobacter lutimaris]NVE95411.1 16S rRNA (guanine(527)-N(7))-methyltransferase RsmG [Altererythrobacter lutimaris]